ncbi:hypothetical protein CLV62_104192 [Dysgonomonas alginatilytica]|uniref:DDE superfamily endonuclease n=1 Tax=Dysgonomonas alginatilytica TaxID=1605892 RepID=A0A2V3PRI2_9BACT|nr:hypothetical protein [Dysgonomonas alginatilytica]PXV66930.1 hypothetical protein CLV62_104192 [Dysgonomonas alginatilytica]
MLTKESKRKWNLKFTPCYDKKILDEQPLSLPLGATMWQDTEFIGHKPENLIVNIPTRKPKIKLLTDNQKEENRKKHVFASL